MILRAHKDIAQSMADIKVLKAEIAELKAGQSEAVDSQKVD